MASKQFKNPFLTAILLNPSDKIAAIQGSNAITYAGLMQAVQIFKDKFQQEGLRSGDSILLEMNPEAKTIAQFLALVEMNAIITLLPVMHKQYHELADLTGAKAAIKCDKIDFYSNTSHRPAIFNALSESKVPGIVLLSSGSTGVPKLVVHDFNRFSRAYLSKKQTNLSTGCMLLLDHIGGLNTMLNALATSSTIVFPRQRNTSDMLEAIVANKVNVIPASPSLLNLLLIEMGEREYDLSFVKVITFGTEPMPESLLKRVKQRFKSARLIQTYGTSETGIAPGNAPAGNTGLKINDPSYQLKIENGELWIKSNKSALGYAGLSSDQFTNNGWFRTGDLAEFDEEGFLKIKGRLSDTINVGGEKVLPFEIENLVLQVAGMIDCLAYSIPNIVTGQAVGLKIVTERNDFEETKVEIIKYLRLHLQRYKIPVKITFVQEIPNTRSFKKQRKN